MTTWSYSLSSALLLASPALADPPPDKPVGIEVITANGTGCAKDTAAIAVSADNTAFTVTYSDYLAQVGVGARPPDDRKACQLNVHIRVPAGFTYAIASANYLGFASLAPGAIGVERARYLFQGQSPPVFIEHSVTGPFVDDWVASDTADVAGLTFAPCGMERNLNLHTELRVMAGTSDPATTTSFMTMDSADGSLQTTYRLAWKRCP